MNVTMNDIGFLNLSGFHANDLNLKQIYSPSRLYSVLIPKKVDTGLSLKELFFLDTASRTVKKYTLKTYGHEEDFKVNCLYWLADFLLVSVSQRGDEISQTLFTVDHVTNTIFKDKERSYGTKANTLSKYFQDNFKIQTATITLDGRDYLAWPGNADIDDGHFCLFLIPKNPLATIEIKQFAINMAPGSTVLTEVCNFLRLRAGQYVSVDFPSFSNGSQLLCRIGVSEGTDSPTEELFGAYVAYEVSKMVDIYGKDDHDLLEIDYIQESAISLTLLQRPSHKTPEEFYNLVKCTSSELENQYLMVKAEPEKPVISLLLVNFNTMEFQVKVVNKEGFSRFSLHPDGIVLLWNHTDDNIKYKKVTFNWKSDSLLDISRKSLYFNSKIDSTKVAGLQPILFPGSEIIFKPLKVMSLWDHICAYFKLTFNVTK